MVDAAERCGVTAGGDDMIELMSAEEAGFIGVTVKAKIAFILVMISCVKIYDDIFDIFLISQYIVFTQRGGTAHLKY